MCTIRFEPRRRIITADFERLVAARRWQETMTEANNEKFAVLRGILVSRIDIHQARAETMQETMAEMKFQIGTFISWIDARIEATETCLEKTEARNQRKPKVRLAQKHGRPKFGGEFKRNRSCSGASGSS